MLRNQHIIARTNDFIHNTGTTPSVFADGQAGMLGVATPLGKPLYDLYGGQIGAWTMKTQAIPAGTLNGATLLRNGTLVGERFRYDVLGRLREDTTYSHDGTNWVSDGAGGWSAGFRYDQNSNMRKVKRSILVSTSTIQLVDDAVFLTGGVSNSINSITDIGTTLGGSYVDEIRAMAAPSSGIGYYNERGELESVPMVGVPGESSFSSNGLVSKHDRGDRSVEIIYDADGYRVRLDVYNTEGESRIFLESHFTPDPTHFDDPSHYIRVSSSTSPLINQWSIIGASRLGVHYTSESERSATTGAVQSRFTNLTRYELSDHAGSVRVIISDRKQLNAGIFESDQLSTSEYDAYGGRRWLRDWCSNELYRYGWQGMRHLDGQTNRVDYFTSNRIYDIRLANWISLDPIFNPSRSSYEAMGSNPLCFVDPLGLDYYYSRNGKYLGKIGTGEDVYTADRLEKVKNESNGEEGLVAINSKKLAISHPEYQRVADVVDKETGSSQLENRAVAHTINNRARRVKRTMDKLAATKYSSVKKGKLNDARTDADAVSAREAVINVLEGGSDPTNGAEFWDGTDLLAWGTSETPYGTKGHAKFRQYSRITIPKSLLEEFKNANSKTPYLTWKVKGMRFKYSVPNDVFNNVNKAGDFDYRINDKLKQGIIGTLVAGKSIFWLPVPTSKSTDLSNPVKPLP